MTTRSAAPDANLGYRDRGALDRRKWTKGGRSVLLLSAGGAVLTDLKWVLAERRGPAAGKRNIQPSRLRKRGPARAPSESATASESAATASESATCPRPPAQRRPSPAGRPLDSDSDSERASDTRLGSETRTCDREDSDRSGPRSGPLRRRERRSPFPRPAGASRRAEAS